MPSNILASNAYASVICNNLDRNHKCLSSTLTRMASGFKIQNAKDDAAGSVISTKMNIKLSGLKFANDNIQNSNNLLNVAQSAYMTISDILLNLRSLSIQALDSTYDVEARNAMQSDSDELVKELQRIKVSTKFNSIKLFDNYEEREIPDTPAGEPPEEPGEPQGEPQTTSLFSLNMEAPFLNNTLQEDGKQELLFQTLEAVKAAPMMAGVMPLALGDPTVIAGAIDLAANERNATLIVDGITYTITNLKNYEQSISYSKDTSTGQITFTCNDLEIRAQENVAHNLMINGQRNKVYGGDEADTFEFYDTYSSSNYVYGMGGDDTFNITKTVSNTCYGDFGTDALDNANNAKCGSDTFNIKSTGYSGSMYGGNGNDIFNFISGTGYGYGQNGDDVYNYIGGGNSYSSNGGPGNDVFNLNSGNQTVSGGDGDDIFYVGTGTGNRTINGENGNDQIYVTAGTHTINGGNGNDYIEASTNSNKIYGNAGDDTIKVTGNNNLLYGNENEDTFIISGDNNTVDGNEGTNTITDNGTNTTKLNVPGGTYQVIITKDFARKEVQTVEIAGKEYKITNKNNSANTLKYEIADDGRIMFLSSSFSIEAVDKSVSHYVELKGTSNDFTGGDVVDTILFSANTGTIHGLKGNDIIKKTGNYSATIYGDEGDDYIEAYTGTIHGGAGNDTITATATVYGDDGDDIITNNGTTFAGNGNDTITITGQDNYLDAGDGDDTVILKNGNYQKIFLGDGDDTIKTTANLSNWSYIDFGSGQNEISGVNTDLTTVNNNRTISGNVNMFGTEEENVNNLTGTININALIDGFSDSEFTKVQLDKSQTKVVTINGVEYEVKNRWSDRETSLYYKFDEVQNKVIFSGVNVNITGKDDVPYTIDLYGRYNYLTTKDQNDTVNVYGRECYVYTNGGDDLLTATSLADNTRLYGGEGKDILTGNGSSTSYYGEGGDDTLYVNGSVSALDGGEGNDAYYITRTTNSADNFGNNIYYVNANGIKVTAASGNDTFYVSGNDNTLIGAGGDDYFVLSGLRNKVDGGTGTNYIVDTSAGATNQTQNSEPDPNAGKLYFSSSVTEHEIHIDGKVYKVKNINAEETVANPNNTVAYSYNRNTGEIMIIGSNVTINASDGVVHNIRLDGSNNVVNGGNLDDNIIVQSGEGNIINGKDGNDTITLNSVNNSALGGNGNDTINVNATTGKKIDGEDGNDKININSNNNTKIYTGLGNDTVRGKDGASNNTIYLNGGVNDLLLNGNSNNVYSTTDKNRISVVGNDSNISATGKNNTIGIKGNSNTVNASFDNTYNIVGSSNEINSNGAGTFNITGERNQVESQSGNYKVKGNSNILTSKNGTYTVKGNFNTITAKSDVKFNINGNENHLFALDGNQNVVVNGNANDINFDSKTSKIEIKGNENIVETNGSEDKVIVTGNENIINTNDKQDNVKIYGDSNIVQMTSGFNNIYLRGSFNEAYGGSDIDNFQISKGIGNIVDGGDLDKRNVLYNYGETSQYDNVVLPKALKVKTQVGANVGTLQNITTKIDFQLGDLVLDYSTREKAIENIEQIDEIRLRIEAELASIGAQMNRLESIFELNQKESINLSTSKSIITDADIAKEAVSQTSKVIKENIITSLMAQSINFRKNYYQSLMMGLQTS